MAERYPFQTIEPKWQRHWEEKKLFRAVDGETSKKKWYILDMFPYPSGAGLHVGHPEGYTATDITARFRRMQGYNVLHPIGWDAFGLPAEQYAIDTGTHPAETTRKNIATFTQQIKRLGFSYDWDREIDTTAAGYVKWTQWIFLQLFKQGLAYQMNAPVWWCPSCGTVLANEEVIDGKCERKGHPVERKPMRQWMLKITAYAERLLSDLDQLDWPSHIKDMQRHWIGKSEGAEVWFALDGKTAVPDEIVDGAKIRQAGDRVAFKIYTTRPDTLFGATYMVLSPEHVLVPSLTTVEQKQAVERYQQNAASKSEMERTELAKEKTGVFTGAYALNPVNGERVPIWIADYVLASYGTGAIMAVPAHDQRDLEFARKFKIPVRVVIVPTERALDAATLEEAFPDDGRMQDSGPFTGLPSAEAKGRIVEWLSTRDLGKSAVNYKLRDWLFSRQRYWGEPIPIVHCKKCGIVPVPEGDLPVLLPPMSDFKPSGTGEPPLAKAKDWVRTTCPNCKQEASRETNTMPQWAGSCWYYLRYLDPKNDKQAWDPVKERYWMPVDLYIGGAEHAVLHLLYSRFWHKVLFDLKLVSTAEPFHKLINQGLILGEDGEKMSKSRGNVVNPDDIIKQYGADSFRLYEMFMGPLEAVKPWSTKNIEGVDRFLNRVWRLVVDGEATRSILVDAAPEGDLNRLMHATIRSVTDDLTSLRFNTAISSLMVFSNALGSAEKLPRRAIEVLVLLLSPLAPHISEELWQRLGHKDSLSYEPWPQYEPKVLISAEVTLVVQVNGKMRARVTVPAEAAEADVRAAALADASVQKFMEGKPAKQVIVVPKRLVNVVV